MIIYKIKKKENLFFLVFLFFILFLNLVIAQPDSSGLPPVPEIDPETPPLDEDDFYDEGKETSGTGAGERNNLIYKQLGAKFYLIISVVVLLFLVLLFLLFFYLKKRRKTVSFERNF